MINPYNIFLIKGTVDEISSDPPHAKMTMSVIQSVTLKALSD